MEFEISLFMILACATATFTAGILDSIAGGGGLITMPAMLLAGVPPHATLGTNKFASTLGTSTSLLTYARSGLVQWRTAPVGVTAALIGSWCGSVMALYIEPAMLGKVLVGLLPLGLLVTLMPKRDLTDKPMIVSGTRFYMAVGLAGGGVGMYDGFFGPGAGSFFIIAFHMILRMSLIQASATAKLFNLASNVGALVAFLWAGEVYFMLGLPMAVASAAGNWAGTRIAIKKGADMVRKFLFVSLGLLMVSLAYKYFWIGM